MTFREGNKRRATREQTRSPADQATGSSTAARTAPQTLTRNRFARGELRVLINVNVLTVGWDCPRVDGIVLMRATESARLLAQIIGRGLRLFDGKTECLLADYAENFERHAKDTFKITMKLLRNDHNKVSCSRGRIAVRHTRSSG